MLILNSVWYHRSPVYKIYQNQAFWSELTVGKEQMNKFALAFAPAVLSLKSSWYAFSYPSTVPDLISLAIFQNAHKSIDKHSDTGNEWGRGNNESQHIARCIIIFEDQRTGEDS